MLELIYILGAAFTTGQLVVSEIGRYEIWSKKKRFITSATVGAIAIIITSPLLHYDMGVYLAVLLILLGTEKLIVKALNAKMPERFQAELEEIKKKYEGIFNIDPNEVEEILRGEKEFLEKIGLIGDSTFEESKNVKRELTELRRAIKRFLERER
jgi:hypothetical protein